MFVGKCFGILDLIYFSAMSAQERGRMAKLCPQCREPSGNADLRRLFCEIRFHCPVCLDDHDARVTPSYALRCGHQSSRSDWSQNGYG